MANIDIKESVSIKRVEAMGSRESHFILGVSNRILIPLGFFAMILSINVSYLWAVAFILFFIMEIVLRYVLKMTLTEMMKVFWRAFFRSERKSVKN
jgi:hypothetical protein